MLGPVRNVADDLATKALAKAEEDLGTIGTPYDEARHVEYAIEYLTTFDAKVREAILQLMWTMEKEQHYVELGSPSMLDWALSNQKIRTLWSKETVDRYAKAISRILPAVEVQNLVDDDGTILRGAEFLAAVPISALADYSHTFATTDDPAIRQEILRSLLRHDSEEKRDAIIRTAKGKRNPLGNVTVYTHHEQDWVRFEGTCTPQQWAASMALLSPFWSEEFVKPRE